MKNSTLGRKPGNTLKSVKDDRATGRKADQRGDGESFAFNGQMGDGVNRSATTHRFAGNQAGLTARVNYGLNAIARKGNASDSSQERREHTGPSVTKDPNRLTIATAAQMGGCIDGGAERKSPANPDKIYFGKAER